jgi:RNA polymerase sigma-70 factor (ECF subfamily)
MADLAPDMVHLLLRRKAQLLAVLEERVGSRADAEDLLQTALLKLVSTTPPRLEDEKLVAWMYRLLRNLLVDFYRERAARRRLASRVAIEATGSYAVIDERLFSEVCACVNDVVATLKPEYAEMLRRVDLEERPLGEVARALGIKVRNASVRLHRARRALLNGLRLTCGACLEHGCLDCYCRRTGKRRDGAAGPGSPARAPRSGCNREAGRSSCRGEVPKRQDGH